MGCKARKKTKAKQCDINNFLLTKLTIKSVPLAFSSLFGALEGNRNMNMYPRHFFTNVTDIKLSWFYEIGV